MRLELLPYIFFHFDAGTLHLSLLTLTLYILQEVAQVACHLFCIFTKPNRLYPHFFAHVGTVWHVVKEPHLTY
jgi:hypothetical protein